MMIIANMVWSAFKDIYIDFNDPVVELDSAATYTTDMTINGDLSVIYDPDLPLPIVFITDIIDGLVPYDASYMKIFSI